MATRAVTISAAEPTPKTRGPHARMGFGMNMRSGANREISSIRRHANVVITRDTSQK